MAIWIQAGLWGLLSGSALLLGALGGWFLRLSQPVIASIMAFGAGVLISALAFELMDEAATRGGLAAAATGFAAGALVYAAANALLAQYGARHRKRSQRPPPQASDSADVAGAAIALGALLDGLPESAALGASLLDGQGVGLVLLAAIFLSNLPEGLSSAAGMRRAGRSPAYVFGIWTAIALLSAIAAALGSALLGGLAPEVTAVTIAIAAGAILVMVIDTMIPEAFAEVRSFTGPVAVVGFLLAFVLGRLA